MIKKSIIMNTKRMKVRYRDTETKKVWYGEYTTSDFRRDLGWSQWGSSSEDLLKTVITTEDLANQWVSIFAKDLTNE